MDHLVLKINIVKITKHLWMVKFSLIQLPNRRKYGLK